MATPCLAAPFVYLTNPEPSIHGESEWNLAFTSSKRVHGVARVLYVVISSFYGEGHVAFGAFIFRSCS